MKIGVVIPAFNESRRLDPDAFRDHPELSFLFVDDGSTDNTSGLVESWNLPNAKVFRLPTNRGKAEAVRSGMLAIHKTYPGLDWVCYWDADLATPLVEISNAIKYGEVFYPDADSIWCSRLVRLGSNIRRSYYRHILGRVFMTVVGYLFRSGVYDSQCGAKLFRTGSINTLFQDAFISQWIFDVEIERRADVRKVKVVEYPLMNWQDVGGSKLNVPKVSFRVLLDLYRIKKQYQE